MASYTITNGPENVPMAEFFARNGTLAKSCRFMLRFGGVPLLEGRQQETGLASASDLSFLCEAAEFPGRGFMSTDIRYYGPNFKVPYQTTFEDLTITIVCREQFLERQFFDTWMSAINPHSTYDFSYRDSYTTQLELFQLSVFDNKPQYAFTFDKAYPVLVSPQPVTWADDNYHRLSITFTYVRWYRKEIDTLSQGTFKLISESTVQTEGGTFIPIPNFITKEPDGGTAPAP